MKHTRLEQFRTWLIGWVASLYVDCGSWLGYFAVETRERWAIALVGWIDGQIYRLWLALYYGSDAELEDALEIAPEDMSPRQQEFIAKQSMEGAS